MIQIDDKLLSDDVIEQKFVCDLKKCKGICCIEGDSGAPLTIDEMSKLEDVLPIVKEYMRPVGIAAVEKDGAYYKDTEGDFVTTLVNGAECAFVVFDEEKIAWCAIERAFNDGKISFRKPSSCYLYPIRTKQFTDVIGVNYDEWDICKSAVKNGKKLDVPVYKFLEQPLTEEYGEEWYKKLCYFAENNPKDTCQRY